MLAKLLRIHSGVVNRNLIESKVERELDKEAPVVMQTGVE